MKFTLINELNNFISETLDSRMIYDLYTVGFFLFFNNSWCDHLIKGIVFAFTGRTDVHQRGADLLLFESRFHQVGNLCLLGKKKVDSHHKSTAQWYGFSWNEIVRNWATHMEHFVDVIIFTFQQLTPGSEITVCEHTAGLQQSVSMTLTTQFTVIRKPFDKMECDHSQKTSAQVVSM